MKSRLILFLLTCNMCGAEPVVTSLFPANGSTNVCTDTPLRLTLDGAIGLGAGKIGIYRATDDKLADGFDLSDAGFTNNFGGKMLRYDPIQVANDTVSIELHSHALSPDESYYVVVERGFISGEFGGITNRSDWRFSTRAAPAKGRTNVVVAADGTGDFCTPQGAVDYVPDDNQTPVEIFIRRGVYNGIVYIAPDKNGIHLAGEDRKGTVIAGRNNDRFNSSRIQRSLVSVDANDFTLENMTLHNTTPYRGSQAEALRIRGERCVLRNDDFYSFQDTLLLSGSVYVTNCYVEGDVDFIWGQGSVFFDRCEIKAVHNGYYLQARNPAGRPGYVFFRCKLAAAPGVTKCLLARIEADRFPYSEAEYIDCEMGPQVPAYGWEVKGTNTGHLRFGEFKSVDMSGNPVDLKGRLPSSRQLSEAEAMELSDPAKVLSSRDLWDPKK